MIFSLKSCPKQVWCADRCVLLFYQYSSVFFDFLFFCSLTIPSISSSSLLLSWFWLLHLDWLGSFIAYLFSFLGIVLVRESLLSSVDQFFDAVCMEEVM
jgi:hypothetical protein